MPDNWSRFVDALADRGIPVYRLTDPLDDAGLPSWAVLMATALILIAAAAFFLLPTATHTLTVKTADGTKVTVSWEGHSETRTADTGTVVFQAPAGKEVTIKLSKGSCGDSVRLELIDDYVLEKPLTC